eukprot:11813155-Ditylum_brightwellii.AAC.1
MMPIKHCDVGTTNVPIYLGQWLGREMASNGSPMPKGSQQGFIMRSFTKSNATLENKQNSDGARVDPKVNLNIIKSKKFTKAMHAVAMWPHTVALIYTFVRSPFSCRITESG